MKPVNQISVFLLIFISVYYVTGELCPPFFGEFECPKNFNCVFGVCKNAKDEVPQGDCSKVECDIDARCINGKCLPVEGLPCGRNILVGENSARSIVSDCGWRGKCINGHCSVDKCFEKLCNEDEYCRDGTCTKVLGAFCWTNFDCGKQRRCQGNQCVNDPDAAMDALAEPRCDPGEIFKDHKCQKNEGCANIVCDIGETCVEGVCVPIALDCTAERCPKGMICRQGLCVLDPCVQRGCPLDHACLLGECRLIQGMICQESCPEPYICHNGVCAKNEAAEFQCSSRCHRLLSRSLSRINYSIEKVDGLLKSNQRIKDLGDVCWKFYDYYDCKQQCEKRSKRFEKPEGSGKSEKSSSDLNDLTRIAVKRCKFVDEEYSSNIRCIQKYHTFIEVRCSSYVNEASRLRKLFDGIEDEKEKKGGIQETCRFLHYHDMCLANTVFFYCPNARKLFNRFTLRDYFLSFVVPKDDEDFDEKFLDSCEVYDFQKMAKDVYDTTSSVKIEELDLKPTTPVPIVKLLEEGNDDEASKEKKVFASEEDLQDNPPNFFYSSAKYETTTYRPVETTKNEMKTKIPAHPSSHIWSPKPVTIEFVSHPVKPSPESMSSFTLDPNEILSTIFKIPNIFPTTVTNPDPTTVTYADPIAVGATKGDIIEVKPESEEDNLYEDLGIDPGNKDSESSSGEDVIWRTKPPKKMTEGLDKKIGNQGIEKEDDVSNQKSEVNREKESGIKSEIGGGISIEATTQNKELEIVDLKKTTYGVNVLLREILPNKPPEFQKSNSTEHLVEIEDKIRSNEPEETSTLSVSTYSEPVLDSSEKKSTVSFELPADKKPLLSGTKVHIKRIRHYSDTLNDKDDSEEEEKKEEVKLGFRVRPGDGSEGPENGGKTSTVDAIFFNKNKPGTSGSSPKDSLQKSPGDRRTVQNSIAKNGKDDDQSKYNETIDPEVDSSLLDRFNEEFAN
ncbi:hypothetical protein FO519_005374 [Halicephalobus sp. NKZ332]|nr:hypothetical protein FO519_005374 [Halicephalobus sp. NKZ332]